MVNEKNVYLVENKKPVELVQELKNEYKIPSFEEFNKTYENDGNLNYDDLSGGDIGVPKSYGPGNDQSKQRITRIVSGVAIGLTTAVCPPAGAALAAGTVAAGAVTVAVTDANDKNDAFVRELGGGLIETGAIGVASGAGGTLGHSGKSCRLAACPKK
jgi:hypothetical protein